MLSLAPDAQEAAAAFRRAVQEREIAVLLNGRIVGVEPPNTSWSRAIPGGVFASLEDALSAYRALDADITHEPVSPSDADRIRQEWSERDLRSLWELRCDPIVSARLKRSLPEIAREFEKHPELFEGIDCSQPPPGTGVAEEPPSET